MTNYVGFINSMLELRNQRLKESMAKAQLEQDQTEMFAKQMSQAGSSLGRMFEQMGQNRTANQQNATANRVMGENSGILGGAGPGGMDELKMRMGIAGLRERQLGTNLDVDGFGYPKGRDIINDTFKTQDDIRADQEAIARAKDREEDNKRAQESAKQSTLGKDFNNLRSYQDSMKVHINDMRDAPDKATHDRAALSAHNLWAAANKAGLDVGEGPPEIAPFMTPLQKAAIAEQQAKVATTMSELSEAKSAQPGMLDWIAGKVPGMQSKDEGIKAAQDKFNMEQGLLDSLQKGGESFDPNAAAPAAATPQDSGIPVGTTRKSKSTGRRQKWDGQQWIDI